MNNIDALLGLGISDEEQLKMLADRLRGQQRAADFFALSSVAPISGAAQAEQKRVTNSAAQAGILNKALQDRKLKQEEGRLDRAALLKRAMILSGGANDPTQAGTTKNVGRWVNRKTGEETTVGFRYGVPIDLIRQMPIDLTGWVEQTPMSETSEMTAMARVGERIEGVNQMIGRMTEIDRELGPYLEKGIPVEDIPGLGFWEKMPLIGSVTRGIKDLMAEGAPQAAVFQAVSGLMNTINRTQAGLTQTKGEMERIRDETGLNVFEDPQAFAKSFERIRRAIDRDLSLVRASTPPRIWNEIKQQYPEDQQSIFNWSAKETEQEYPQGFGGIEHALGIDEVESRLKQPSEMTIEEIMRELNGG